MKVIKKERLLKRLKNIEDKSEEQLKMIENKNDNQLGIKSVTSILDKELSQEGKKVLIKLNIQEKIINYKKLDFRRDKDLKFEFSDHRSSKELLKEIYYRNISIDKAEIIEDEYDVQLNALEN